MSNKKWNLEDPQQAEEALNYLYSLPDDEWNSEAEVDDEDVEEFAALDKEGLVSGRSSLDCSTSSIGSSISLDGRLDSPPITADGPQNRLVNLNLPQEQEDCTLEPPDQAADTDNIRIENSSDDEDEVLEDTEWTQESEYFDKLSVSFEEEPSANLSADNNGKEISYLQEILDDNILQSIVDQSNLYANQKGAKNWYPLTLAELKAYIGCSILMGIHQLPRLENYWSSDPFLGVKSISDVMTAKRFKKITETLHCNDNATCPARDSPDFDKLYKLRPLINFLNARCLAVYNCSSNLSVDESMIAFKGRCSFKQYMPLKPIKRGYKVWCLADAKTGFVTKFEVYTGKKNTEKASKNTVNNTAKNSKNNREIGLGEKVVWTLTKHLKNRKCLVAFDNFFTSVSLMKKLHRNGIFSVGTVQINRKGLPDMMKKKHNLSRGEFMFESRGVVSAVKWQDSKPVTLLTTALSPKVTTVVRRTNKDGSRTQVYCPKVVETYNAIMGGVDRFDQRKERYTIGRRSVKWWHRIFFFLIDLAIVNSYILRQLSKRRNEDQLTFRIGLARQLISGYSNRKRRGKPVQFLANKRMVPEEVRLSQVGSHFPEQGTYRRCRICSTKQNEKRTRFTCSQCKVPVCVPACFKKLHQKAK